jgi:hypothetical protein
MDNNRFPMHASVQELETYLSVRNIPIRENNNFAGYRNYLVQEVLHSQGIAQRPMGQEERVANQRNIRRMEEYTAMENRMEGKKKKSKAKKSKKSKKSKAKKSKKQ